MGRMRTPLNVFLNIELDLSPCSFIEGEFTNFKNCEHYQQKQWIYNNKIIILFGLESYLIWKQKHETEIAQEHCFARTCCLIYLLQSTQECMVGNMHIPLNNIFNIEFDLIPWSFMQGEDILRAWVQSTHSGKNKPLISEETALLSMLATWPRRHSMQKCVFFTVQSLTFELAYAIKTLQFKQSLTHQNLSNIEVTSSA